MNKNRWMVALLAGSLLLTGSAYAMDSNAVLGGALGGGAGAAVGSALGGRDGAMIGAAAGAAIGTGVATRPEPRRTIVEHRYVEERGWKRGHRHHHHRYDD
ncbi:hypothetical protein NH8B_1463 [Pseudogulbenkiania sp. NH8B]|uniref:Glycine zipper n=2 Tax=Pseudogulbenkiania TaxID=568394 RepID=A0A1Y6BSD8_9NEIS|nr:MULTISPECIES: hypothetical protein [Pseudogulbenkiania]EEG08898.1 17 kDa surface antigen [Pseudogulbenkiania ferrooxidans 2002]BAK76285.1 hypothetical protein NH8B_1463 [Pseudogulbenkiania sp. NH8B]SMF15670.1 hypothetical protein SAMN02745746_01601 [Pseudogulbenkiania subflava DSM 22618]